MERENEKSDLNFPQRLTLAIGAAGSLGASAYVMKYGLEPPYDALRCTAGIMVSGLLMGAGVTLGGSAVTVEMEKFENAPRSTQ